MDKTNSKSLDAISACESGVRAACSCSENANSSFNSDIISSSKASLTLSHKETITHLGATVNTNDKSQTQRSHKLSGEEAERRYKLWLRVEIVGLCILILTVWSLLLLPTVFYHQSIVSEYTHNAPDACQHDRISFYFHKYLSRLAKRTTQLATMHTNVCS